MPGTTRTELFNCTAAEFYGIVSDYVRYPEFLQEVKQCKVLESEGDRRLVEFTVSVVKSFSYRLWMTERAPTMVTWTFAGGDIFKTSSGSWRLEDQDGKCRAEYAVEATFSMFVPGMIAKTLLTVNLPTMMNAYHKRVKEIYGK